VDAINVQTQGVAAQLTEHKRLERSSKLAESDIWLPQLFRQTVSQRWPGGHKTVVTELVV